MTIHIGIAGCMGRMGRALTSAVLASEEASIAGGTEPVGSIHIGKAITDPATGADLGHVVIDCSETLFENCDVVIDFTSPTALQGHLLSASASGKPLVVGTTGLTDIDHAAIDGAAQSTAILQAGNMSLGVNLLTAVVQQVAAILGPRWDAEILEMHHRNKVDAPSGTALMLGDAVAQGRGKLLDDVACKVRDGIIGPRAEGEIGFATLRGGGVVGDHTVIFAGVKEQLEFSHKAHDRSLFADGAVQAAVWVADKNAGRYSMMDVLGLKGGGV